PLLPPPPRPTLFPYTTLFRSEEVQGQRRPPRVSRDDDCAAGVLCLPALRGVEHRRGRTLERRKSGARGSLRAVRRYGPGARALADRKSTRLNSSHDQISYAVF